MKYVQSKTKPPAYGGQAVVEGVMFGGKKNYVTAIRRKDQSIEFLKLPRTSNKQPPFSRKKSPLSGGVLLHLLKQAQTAVST
ncbi:hypothetical protein BsIDN1_42800 [Bacillus safensis]|uniref:DUF1385 domain-containing protein n=1 Tax=Bacillus safensis TaxID=561879 RepID=A0A5S9MDJ7_BACIA|nr:hypothetical protein BsIDN1_42800 [Bacillus safensis]